MPAMTTLMPSGARLFGAAFNHPNQVTHSSEPSQLISIEVHMRQVFNRHDERHERVRVERQAVKWLIIFDLRFLHPLRKEAVIDKNIDGLPEDQDPASMRQLLSTNPTAERQQLCFRKHPPQT